MEIRFGDEMYGSHVRLIFDRFDPQRGRLYKLQSKGFIRWKDSLKDGHLIEFPLTEKNLKKIIEQYT